jgi:Fe2+ or Zn2+ uptake regulation protein
MKLTANKIAGILREHGCKLTPQRRTLLKVIASQHILLSPDEIYKITRQEYLDIKQVNIYRNLELLNKLNLLCRVHSPDGCCNYMMRKPTEHHHHLVYSGYGRAVDFTDCGLSNAKKTLAEKTGFTIEGHLLELYGRCQDCQKANRV